jgi:hypothetical protein
VACILITYLGFAMLRFSNIEQKYMRKLDGAARSVSELAGWRCTLGRGPRGGGGGGGLSAHIDMGEVGGAASFGR